MSNPLHAGLGTVRKREPISPNERQGRQRRAARRYPVAADVAYQWVADGKIVSVGRGRSVNISSGGVLLELDDALPAGVSVALQIVWPVKLDSQVALALHVYGRTLRSDGRLTAVVITKHEFRTLRRTTVDRLAAAALFAQS